MRGNGHRAYLPRKGSGVDSARHPVRGPPLGFGIAAEFSDHAADRMTTRHTRGGRVGLDVGQPVLPCTQTVSFPPATPRVEVALNGLDLIRD